jgi:DNA-directed RNA polymerase subunit alpha
MSDSTIKNNVIQKSTILKHSDNSYSFVVEPLNPGDGYTLGNSLRRILLSSIPGYAVTRVSINDITHEYQPVAGVVEDAMEIMLNLKNLRVKVKTGEEKLTLHLSKKGAGDVLARDIKTDGKFEICNPDLYICSLNKDAKLDIEIEVSKGVGYLPLERINLGENNDPRKLLVDALFSPVANVMLKVEDVRVGDMTNHNRLTINFETDGTVSADEIIQIALDINIDRLNKIRSSFSGLTESTNNETTEVIATEDKKDEINLPKKILNILAKHDIVTNEDLIDKAGTIEELNGLDEKMIASIKKYLEKLDK